MHKKIAVAIRVIVLISVLISSLFANSIGLTKAATLLTASTLLSDPRPDQTAVTYTLGFSGITTITTIRCFQVYFSQTADAGTVPGGMDTTSATFTGGADPYVPTSGSWTVDATVNGLVKMTLAGGETPAAAGSLAVPRNVILSNITNGSTAGTTYYVFFTTYTDAVCTTAVDTSMMAYTYTDEQTVTATIDPTLTFVVTGVNSGSVNGTAINTTSTTSSLIPLGTLSAVSNKVAAQNLHILTNANNGYTVTVRYNGTYTSFTSGAHSISETSMGTNTTPTTFPAAGTEAFGYTTEDSSLGTGTANRFTSASNWAKFTTTAAEIAYSSTAADDNIKIGFQAGISAITPAGSYTTKLIYTVTPIY